MPRQLLRQRKSFNTRKEAQQGARRMSNGHPSWRVVMRRNKAVKYREWLVLGYS